MTPVYRRFILVPATLSTLLFYSLWATGAAYLAVLLPDLWTGIVVILMALIARPYYKVKNEMEVWMRRSRMRQYFRDKFDDWDKLDRWLMESNVFDLNDAIAKHPDEWRLEDVRRVGEGIEPQPTKDTTPCP